MIKSSLTFNKICINTLEEVKPILLIYVQSNKNRAYSAHYLGLEMYL